MIQSRDEPFYGGISIKKKYEATGKICSPIETILKSNNISRASLDDFYSIHIFRFFFLQKTHEIIFKTLKDKLLDKFLYETLKLKATTYSYPYDQKKAGVFI